MLQPITVVEVAARVAALLRQGSATHVHTHQRGTVMLVDGNYSVILSMLPTIGVITKSWICKNSGA